MKKFWKAILSAILMLLVVIFSVINTRNVRVDFGFKEIYTPLIYVLLGSFLLGLLASLLLFITSTLQNRKIIKNLRSELSESEQFKEEKLEQSVYEVKNELEQQLEIKDSELASLKNETQTTLEEKEQIIQKLEEHLRFLEDQIVPSSNTPDERIEDTPL